VIDFSETQSSEIKNLPLLARQIVEGFTTGMHRSPFHGFSAEFSEHKSYNKGESIRHIDWKLFAKTQKFYTKKYEEETNLRCHMIIDNSASMHFPVVKSDGLYPLNKIGFSVLAAAAIMEVLKRQRDAVGLSIYADSYQYYAPEKGSDRHHSMLLHQLEALLRSPSTAKTETVQYLHEIAEKINRRSLILLFTDMFQAHIGSEKLFEALGHLKYNKHQVVLFHTFDRATEVALKYDHSPKKFVDIETGDEVNLFAKNVQQQYAKSVNLYFKKLRNQCLQYKIDYVLADIQQGFSQILTSYFLATQKMR